MPRSQDTSNVLLEVSRLTFGHSKLQPPQVNDISFRIYAGRTFGVLGGNECGKTSLAQLVLGNYRPQQGRVRLFGDAVDANRNPPWLWPGRALLLLMVFFVVIIAMVDRQVDGRLLFPGPLFLEAWRAGAWMAPLFLGLLELGHQLRWIVGLAEPRAEGNSHSGLASPAMRARGVAYLSWEHESGQKLPQHKTIEEVIARRMPLPEPAFATPPEGGSSEARKEVIALLHAAQFQLYTAEGRPRGGPAEYVADGLLCSELSGGQVGRVPRDTHR